MTDYKKTYNELKQNMNEDNSRILSFLIFGIFMGRLYEKYQKIRKNIFKGRS